MHETVRTALHLATETLFIGQAQPQSGGTYVAMGFIPWTKRRVCVP
ncbi:MAG: hypothetical protein ACFCUH_13825 [Flavobacteriales bacterium]